MTPFKKKILIVDDQLVNRMLLHKILDESYDVIESDSGENALVLLREQKDVIQAVLLDLIMPGMDGFTFLEIVKGDSELRDIPILITTQSEGVEVEIKVLELGAADYITKPYNNVVILQRIINIIALRENAILRNTSERDPLTFLYNKETFNKKVPELLRANPTVQYAILYMDIERFKIVNDFFGEKVGDKILCYIAKLLSEYSDPTEAICSRHNGDIFAICMPNSKENIKKYIDTILRKIGEYPLKFRLNVNFGVYPIEDIELPVPAMCDRASTALEKIIGKYDVNVAYYDDSHRRLLLEEQEIVNEMAAALKEGQFQVYLQPKFDLRDFSIIGAEALVRWVHPIKGFIGPDKFIPIFERNGFVTELDVFVWDTTCKHIRKWLDNGWPVVPISVNVSRVDIYRPDICDVFSNLLLKYDLSADFLELEITETAYTQNADQLIETVVELKSRGFCLSMDDFGSGYSSLNMLNEVPVDVLKIDMKLLKNIDEKNKSSNIINFVVSMAKWLNLSVISEGIETIEQVKFLRSIGCNHGQGYFFSKPLPIPEFEEKMRTHKPEKVAEEEPFSAVVSIEDVWDPNSQFNTLFNSFVGALGLYECKAGKFALLRANDQFYQNVMPNCDELYAASVDLLPFVIDDDRENFVSNLQKIRQDKGETIIDIRMHVPGLSDIRWHRMHLKVIYHSGDDTIFLATVEDITTLKTMELNYIRNEHCMERILENCSICSFKVNFENRTLESNDAAKKIYGFKDIIENVAETFIHDGHIHEPNAEEIRSFFGNLFEGKANKEISLQCKRLDNTIHAARLFCEIEFDDLKASNLAFCILCEDSNY